VPPTSGQPARHRRRGVAITVAFSVALATIVAIAVAVSSDGSEREESIGAAESASVSAEPTPTSPHRLRAAPGSFRVVLTWSPGEGPTPDGYTIYRDGLTIGVAEATDRRFVDDEALPATPYRYAVRSYVGTYGEESNPASVRTRTPTPPPATARLQGVYEVEMEMTSSYGVTDVDDETGAWRMVPDCDEGPCDTRMGDLNGPLPRIELTRSGAVYDGDATSQAGFQCGGVGITATYRLHLRVEKAAVVAGMWRASRLTGTLSISLPEALGCRSGGVTYAVTALVHEGP
jgi:hypothetical protein